ncbi:T9SS type A sorting domain-containing protein [bacterium]|nr:T9SS type A sorting domain-containing protein [bacterium]
MKKMTSIALFAIFAVAAFAAEANMAPESAPTTFNKRFGASGVEIPADVSQSQYRSVLREMDGILVDSSKNGWGMHNSETTPVSRNEANPDQFILGYRQFAGLAASSGVLGAAYSEDGGASFITFSNLNDGLSTNGARYPSAMATENYPILIWNESGGGGGGANGGRVYYTFDEGEYGGEIFYDPTDVHNNPPANDSWVAVPSYNTDAEGNNYFNVVINDWDNNRDHLLFHAAEVGGWGGSEFSFGNGYTIVNTEREFRWDGSSSYVGTGDLDINDDGIGYYVVPAYAADADTNTVGNHTIFIKKTTDYGAHWSGWFYQPDEIMDPYFESVFPDSAYDMFDSTVSYLGGGLGADWSPFVGYDLEVITDPDGGCHVWAGVLPTWGESVYIRYSEDNGIYHFYAPLDAFAGVNGPVPMEISPMVGSMQMGWAYDLPGWQANTIDAAYDITVEGAMYVTYYTVTDTGTSETGDWSDANIMGSYSLDNGTTWSTPINMTNTVEQEADEFDPHINRVADDGHVYMLYQIPDYDVQTVEPMTTSEDYMQRLFFWDYQFELPVATDDVPAALPMAMSLNQNYPNPFNPGTQISFELPEAGYVELTVFDITGREMVSLHNGQLNAGKHSISFNGESYASGTYFYRLEANGQQAVKKMLLVK